MTNDAKPEAVSSQLLVQISDTHLCADPGHALRGVNTLDCLQAVLNLGAEDLNEADQIIVTGDISHDESLESYSLIRDLLSGFGEEHSFLPGNHDDPEVMRQALPRAHWPAIDQLGDWRLISLNSLLKGEEAGFLDSDQLQQLETLLDENRAQPTVVALHHPPLAVGSQWMDKIILQNRRALQDLLGQYRQVRAVMFGHAHQELDVLRDGIRWLGCPSSCLQFLPGADSFAIDDRLPGYRWLRLYDDGTLETAVERIESWPMGSEPGH